MTTPISPSPADKARALRLLRRRVPDLGINPATAAWLDNVMRGAEILAAEPIVFEFNRQGFAVNGQPIRYRGKGLALAWTVLATLQARQRPLSPAAMLDGGRPDVIALRALERAADGVTPLSPGLASAIRAIGTENGVLTLKRGGIHNVRCTIARDILHVFRRHIGGTKPD